MNGPRSDFNPCFFEQQLYLCGGLTEAVEAFDLTTYTLSSLSVCMPENSPCIVAVENRKLLVISETYVTWWVSAERKELMLVSETKHQNIGVRCSMPPEVDSVNGLLFISYGGRFSNIKLDGTKSKEIGR